MRAARWAVSALFFLNAVLFANLVPRLPDVKDRLDLSNAELGGAVAAMPFGSLVAGLFAPVLIQRFGSGNVAALGLVGLGAAVAGVPWAGSLAGLVVVMLLVGAVDAVVDTGQNAHGFRVQRAYGRSVINGMHALWSIGAVTGGLLGSAAVGLEVPLSTHLAVSAVVFAVVAVVARRFLLPGAEDAERTDLVVSPAEGPTPPVDDPAGSRASSSAGRGLRRVPSRTWGLLAVLGLLAACEAFVQDAASSWGALFMRTEVGTSAAVGGMAFVAMQGAATVGRLVGDRVVDRFGQRRVARVGGALTAVGMALALLLPSVGTAVLGFALAGLGIATLVPAAMHAADEIPGLPAGVGLTVVGWLLRVGFLASPVVVGVLADLTSLRLALGTVVVAGVLVLLGGRVLGDDRARRSDAGGASAPA
ncbi:MFS transporter [Ornithinimicrobium kibberense]|uniref:MFS transporter n=1 Tax=Ornithinimicrobium kibberense TaxID=282060 RepID=UPI00361A168A